MKKNIDAMNHPTKVKESIGERIYTIVVYLLLILISATHHSAASAYHQRLVQ